MNNDDIATSYQIYMTACREANEMLTKENKELRAKLAALSAAAEAGEPRHSVDFLEGVAEGKAAAIRARKDQPMNIWQRTVEEQDAEIARAKAEMKERCAKVAENTLGYDDDLQKSAGCLPIGKRIAAAIRTLKDSK